MERRQIKPADASELPRRGGQRAPIFVIRSHIMSELLSRTIEVGDPSFSQPLSWDRRLSAELCACIAQIDDAVFAGCGFAILRFCPESASDNDLATATWNLFTMLGRPIPQYASGELICRVEVAETAQGANHYSSSNRSGGYHTDGTLLDVQPNLVGLLGLEAADEGGETVLIDGIELAAHLSLLGEPIGRVLREPQLFAGMQQLDRAPSKSLPIIREQSGECQIRYLRYYVEEGHKAAGLSVPPTLASAMDAVDTFCDDPQHQTGVLLERGVLLLWNNLRFVHGRRPFIEHSRRRQLLRFYGNRAP